MRRFLTPFCLGLTAVLLLSRVTPVSAVTRQKARELREEEKNKDNKPHEEEYFERQGTAINIFLQAGKLIGDAARDIDDYGGDFQNKIYYGFGGALETPVTDNLYLGGSFEMDWNSPHQNAGNVRLTTVAIRPRWQFTPLKRATFYLATGIGMASGSYSGNLNIDRDLGSYFSLYLSVGRQMRIGGSSVNGFEFYYRTIFSKGAEVDAVVFDVAEYNVSSIGLKLTFGFQI